MANEFVPYDKMSKKQKREYNRQKRGEPMPAPKVIPNKKDKLKKREKYKNYEDE